MSEPKKLYIKTYGCQMNVYDSERMVEALGGSGYVETQTPDDADMILLNTCHIREKAAEKVYSELGRYKTLKSEKPDLKIGVADVAQAEGEEIMRRQPMVDLVVGPQSYHRLPELEAKAGTGNRAIDTDFPEEDKFEHLKRRPKAKRAPAAFLTVQEAVTNSAPSALCLYPRRRGVAPCRARFARGARSGRTRRARNHAFGTKRQRLSRGGRGWFGMDTGAIDLGIGRD